MAAHDECVLCACHCDVRKAPLLLLMAELEEAFALLDVRGVMDRLHRGEVQPHRIGEGGGCVGWVAVGADVTGKDPRGQRGEVDLIPFESLRAVCREQSHRLLVRDLCCVELVRPAGLVESGEVAEESAEGRYPVERTPMRCEVEEPRDVDSRGHLVGSRKCSDLGPVVERVHDRFEGVRHRCRLGHPVEALEDWAEGFDGVVSTG